jgi:hypothetical protein
VIEARAEDRGGAAIVLRGAEDDDRIRAGRLVASRMDRDRYDNRPPDDGDDERYEEKAAEGTPSGPERHATRY